MVTHHIGGRVLTIVVSTRVDVSDMNLHCTAIFEKPGREWYTQVIVTELLTEFHICPLTSNMT